jgi:hypothetical protein
LQDFDKISLGLQQALLKGLLRRVTAAKQSSFEDLATLEKRTPLDIWIEVCRANGIERCTIPEYVWGSEFVGGASHAPSSDVAAN